MPKTGVYFVVTNRGYKPIAHDVTAPVTIRVLARSKKNPRLPEIGKFILA
jgi:hypothetical protein